MGCGEFLVKYILFFVNLVFALAGLALLGLGVYVQIQAVSVVVIADVSVSVAPITAMVVGGIVFLIAFFGCCGAIRESNCMLVSYSICMLLLMIAKITLATLIFVKLDDLVDGVGKWLDEAFQRDREAFHEIEKTFLCCGPRGALSYLSLTLPDSCCAVPACNVTNAYGGCVAGVQDFFQAYSMAIGILAITIASIELVAVVFGLCLANHVRNKSRRSRY
ncbi:leukocyte surface antigen CD53-like [Epargyreus clarus]|uniref:leukocyte surface antigen CD53-like n=1 Tax=Epargyreus clarus TaxID=520877 RepID=UPI003C2F845B